MFLARCLPAHAFTSFSSAAVALWVAGEYHQARAPGSDGPAYTFQGAAAPDPESLSLGPGAYNPQDPRPGGPAYTLRPKMPAYEEQPGKDSPGGFP